jgi:hypothetical protein
MIMTMHKPPNQKVRRAARKPKRMPSRNKPCPPNDAPVPRDPDIPHWLPASDRWGELPETIRDAIPRILAPAYRRFILDAPNELERSVGLTLVHLIWLELCGQVQLSLAAADPNCLDAILKDPDDMIDRHLRLATVKCQTTELLVKMRMVTEMLQRPQAVALPSPASPLELTPPLIHIPHTIPLQAEAEPVRC